MTRFRLVTYNVHKCKGIDLRVSHRRIADVLCEIKATIIVTQEILFSQATAISTEIGLPVTFGAARQHGGEPYGNAVFTSLRLLSSETHDLTVQTREPRQCLRVSLALTPVQPLHLFAVHLGTSFFERREQARRLVSAEILERADLTDGRILAGDFNEWTHGLTTRLAGERLRSADVTMHLKRRTTYPGVFPFLHLDHIYYDPVFYLRGMHLQRTKVALLASDHLPLIADFEVTESKQDV
jgi:endonuclease/exonuclease/phosphatase family metal-dependent hydrolase